MIAAREYNRKILRESKTTKNASNWNCTRCSQGHKGLWDEDDDEKEAQDKDKDEDEGGVVGAQGDQWMLKKTSTLEAVCVVVSVHRELSKTEQN